MSTRGTGRPHQHHRDYYHALNADPTNPDTGATGAPNPNYTEFGTFTLVRPRSDGRHGH
jgi:hypothetical protein